jgi:hypothetical protein
LAGLFEDFRKTGVGQLPVNWKSPQDSIAVQNIRDRHGIELTRGNNVGGMVVLPPVSLKNDFVLETELELTGNSTFVAVQIQTAKGILQVRIAGNRELVVQEQLKKDIAKSWGNGTTKRFRVERKGRGYVIKLDGQQVQVFDDIRPGEVRFAGFLMGGQQDSDPSPRIYSVRVLPIDP